MHVAAPGSSIEGPSSRLRSGRLNFESEQIMTNTNNAEELVGDWRDRTVKDMSGDKVGSVADIYVDDQTGQPDWLAVSTGLFGTKVSFVPIDGARRDGDDVVVAFEKEKIKDAPRTDADGSLSVDEEQALYDYYGRGYTTGASQTEPATTDTAKNVTNLQRDDDKTVRSDTSGRDASMVRSEEELSVGKTSREAGRVRLRKWVETEDVHLTVPVQRQMARVVREPVADGDTSGVGEFVEGEEEIVLSEETVDVSKQVVGKERIGLEKETVTEQVPVDETVRKERVEVVGDEGVIADRDTKPGKNK